MVVDIPFGALADGADTVTITVTVLDACSTPLSGQTVQLSSTGSGNTITPSSGLTNGSGVFTATIATTLAEVKTILAVVNPGPSVVFLSDMPTTEFVWPVPATYFVRKTGNDSNLGTSPADAWLTISKAAATLTAGDTVFVGAGTYVELVDITGNGSSGSPIRFIADRLGERTSDAGDVLVDSTGGLYTMRINGGDYVQIEGFSVTGATGDASSGGIRVVTSAHNATLRGNRAYGNSYGLRTDDSNDAILEENIVSNNTGIGIRFDDGLNVFAVNNLVYNNGNDGIRMDGVSTATIEGNTIYLNGDDGVDNKLGSTTTVRNNIITDNADNGIGSGGTVTSSYNDVWNNPNGDWSPSGDKGTGDINVDPLYEDPAGADLTLGGAAAGDDRFHLQVTPVLSPAYDVGSADAFMIALSDGTNYADKITRFDDFLDGKSPDNDTVNMGYHYPAGMGTLVDLESGDARLTYGVSDTGALRRPETRMWDDSGSAWSGPELGFPVGSTSGLNSGMVHQISPLDNDEELLAILSEDGTAGTTEFDVHRWGGSEWILQWSTSAIDQAHHHKRAFDLEYETASGDALVVYSDDTLTPVYRALSQGVWSAEISLPLNDGGGGDPDPNTGIVRWVELAPAPSGNEIALAYVDENDDLVALLWDGSAWDTATVKTLDTVVKTNASTGEVENRAFDVAYESLSGDVMVVWGIYTAFGVRSAILPAGTTTWDATINLISAPVAGEVHFIDLAAEPGSDYIAGGFVDLGDGTERLGLATWDGTTWLNGGEYDSQIIDVNDVAEGDFAGAVGWVGNTGVAVCVYPDDNTGAMDWARWTSAGGWVIQSDVTISGMGNMESALIGMFPGQNKLMVVLSDSNLDLFGATYDGTTWTITGGGAAIDTDLIAVDSMPFSLGMED